MFSFSVLGDLIARYFEFYSSIMSLAILVVISWEVEKSFKDQTFIKKIPHDKKTLSNAFVQGSMQAGRMKKAESEDGTDRK